MEAVQALTGHGGWPLNVFLTPDQEPFFGGTYWPPRPRAGMPSFTQVLEAIAALWRDRRDEALSAGARARPSAWAARQRSTPRPSRLTAARSTPPLARWDAATTPATAASARRPSSRRTARSNCSRRAASARCPRRRCEQWRSAASATRSAAASRATRSTRPGPSRTSRRCSTTTRCSRAPTCAPGRTAASRCSNAPAARRSSSACASCVRPRAASTPRSTPTRRASRVGSTSGASRSCAPSSARSRLRRSPTSGPPRRATSRAPTCSRPAAPSRRSASEIRARLLEARAQRVRPALDDKRLTSWNALMIAALADAGAVLWRAALPRGRGRRRGVRLGADARRARAPAAQLQPRRGAHRRLPRGPRVPARGALGAL